MRDAQDEGHRELVSGPHRTLKGLVSLVIGFGGVHPGGRSHGLIS